MTTDKVFSVDSPAGDSLTVYQDPTNADALVFTVGEAPGNGVYGVSLSAEQVNDLADKLRVWFHK